MKGATVTSHVLATLPDELTAQENILADLMRTLPQGEPRQHVRVLLTHIREFRRSLAAAQAELPLLFDKPEPTTGGTP